MTEKLWEASKKIKKNYNFYDFEKFLFKKFNINFKNNYKKIQKWSIKKSPDFWSSFWDFSNIKGLKGKKKN